MANIVDKIGEKMIDHHWDVISFDSIGMPYDAYSQELTGLGGSESQDMAVLEGLSASGLKVMSINRISSPCRRNGVVYMPLSVALESKPKCKTLILQRSSPMPQDITAEQIIIRATDIYGEDYDANLPLFDSMPVTLATVSNWQSEGFPETFKRRRTIYNMIPDELYEMDANRNTPAHSFIYASAAIKGLNETLQCFNQLRETREFENATLKVCCPAYSTPNQLSVPGVTYLGSIPQSEVIKHMRNTRNLLHVSTFPETFGIAHVQAEVLGLNLFVFQSQGRDALGETCGSPFVTDIQTRFNVGLSTIGTYPQSMTAVTPKNFRSSKIIKQWIDLVNP